MNRQEALEKLQEYYDWNFDDEEYDEYNDIYNEQKQNIEDIIEYLKQPISLVDFLGWKEDKEYIVYGERYKLVNNKIWWFDDRRNFWDLSHYDNVINNLLEAPKIKKYYIKLYQKWIEFYSIKPGEGYLNNKISTDKCFLGSKRKNTLYKTQFTTEEIKEIKKLDYINFEQFEIIEVGEDK